MWVPGWMSGCLDYQKRAGSAVDVACAEVLAAASSINSLIHNHCRPELVEIVLQAGLMLSLVVSLLSSLPPSFPPARPPARLQVIFCKMSTLQHSIYKGFLASQPVAGWWD